MPQIDQVGGSPGPLILTVGRVNLDLYVKHQGISIAEATTFVASVGGSPTNIAIAAQLLGVPSALLSAEGGDHVGALVRAQLTQFGVDTRWLKTIPTGATSLALLATLQPDVGERQFYRHQAADTLLQSDVVAELPWDSLHAVALSGDALAQGTTPHAVAAVAQETIRRGIELWWDLDLRPSSWSNDPDRYGRTLLPALSGASAVIGTEEEFSKLLGVTETEALIGRVRALGIPATVVKLGSRGALLIRPGLDEMKFESRAACPVSTVGGGDSVAGALLAAHVSGLSWPEAMELAMAAAAWTVDHPYCSSGFPTGAQLSFQVSGRQKEHHG